MNERIRELAGKALDEAVPETWTTLTVYELNKFTDKFAELIVRECANLPFKSTGEVTTIGEIAVSNLILKHFGVEE